MCGLSDFANVQNVRVKFVEVDIKFMYTVKSCGVHRFVKVHQGCCKFIVSMQVNSRSLRNKYYDK